MRWLTFCISVFGTLAVQAQSRVAVFEDDFGYVTIDSNDPRCDMDFVDIAATGSALTLGRDDAGDAMDDGVVTVALGAEFEFYGQSYSEAAVSSNGYVAFGNDDGLDFSNDCPLPAVPGNERSTGPRAMVMHDDLSADGGSDLLYEFFDDCPRASGTQMASACTVVQWNEWRDADGATLTVQAVIYHGTLELAFQYELVPDSTTGRATVGLQNTSATSAASASCDQVGRITSQSAVCFYAPAFPAAAPPVIFADGFE